MGLGAYTQYKVITTRRNAEVVVWRRFREFVALDAILVEKFRGYIVPPRPEKNAVEAQRMTGSFIQERRLALEKYLNKLAVHPEIKNCEVDSIFCPAKALFTKIMTAGTSCVFGNGRRFGVEFKMESIATKSFFIFRDDGTLLSAAFWERKRLH